MRDNMLRLLLLILFLIPSLVQAQNYTLEIIAPRAGLSTTNRYYKAYPGLLYEVNVAVIGGDYPFTYSLTTAPAGMSINSSTGQITWSDPTVSGSPHTVTAHVVDSAAHTADVTWTITVTTSGFIFVDDSAADGGDGSLANPFNTVLDWYISNTDATYVNNFVYLRQGTYDMTGVSTSDGNWRSNKKPQVYLAYPSETPTWDFTASRIYEDSLSDNWYMDGITLTGAYTYKQVRLAGGDNQQFRKCTFTGFNGGESGTNSTPLYLDAGVGNYKVVIGNTFTGIDSGYGILMYATNKTLIADNTFSSFTNTVPTGGSYGIGPKCGNTNTHIRGNTFTTFGSSSTAIHSYYCGSAQGSWPDTADIEISYNNIYGTFSGTSLRIGDSDTTAGGVIYVKRNTFTSPVYTYTKTAFGPFYFDNNVIQNSDTGDHITQSGTDTSRVIITDDLVDSSGLVDSNGLLVNRSYVGTYGWELDNETPADTTPPIITAFTMPSTASSLTVSITAWTDTDDVAVTQWCLTETNDSDTCSWVSTRPTSYTFSSAGSKTLYAFSADAADNVSDSASDGVEITLPEVNPVLLLGASGTCSGCIVRY